MLQAPRPTKPGDVPYFCLSRDGDKPLAHEHWIVAFANILFQKEILTPGELAKKMDEVAARYSGETTPCS
jgi:hypothetical protein